MRTYAIVNQKGGTGKSTIAHATAAGLALRGFRVLAVDLDAQRNLTDVSTAQQGSTALNVLEGEARITDAIQETGNYSLLPGDAHLASADKRLDGTGAPYLLREALEEVAGRYDFCIIDTPGNLGILTTNALTAADAAVIATTPEYFSTGALNSLAETIGTLRKYTNPGLNIAAVVVTNYDKRAALYRDMAGITEGMAKNLGARFYTIRRAVAVPEAATMQQSIFAFAPKAGVTQDFNAYLDGLLEERK